MNKSGQIFLPKGFRFSAVTAGIKASGKPDLALIVSVPPANAASLFTKNLIAAAPVEVGRSSLAKSRGKVSAVIVNSGNANCATGKRGIQDCKAVCVAAAKELNVPSSQVFPSSTGIIGVRLPASKIKFNLTPLLAAAGSSMDHLRQFANAILTTDTRPKLASVRLQSGAAAISGIAKGSGMIHPQLATMLVYILTDVVAGPATLRRALKSACDETFNLISVDGDTSTNDTVLLLASGASQIKLTAIRNEFETALLSVCRSLADQIIADGEGVQHIIRLRIEQAKNRADALQVARTISHSLLVKTAWAGADPNWGRILAAVGRSGVRVDPQKITIRIGDQIVCRGSVACDFDERRAHQELSKPESRVTVRLQQGTASSDFLTTDLTAEYVRINADYST
jgi:glutamate N-acetyltransferase/amino-acid acetyltransferase